MPDAPASIHQVDIEEDARTHYHRSHTEIYYILEGTGQMRLAGEIHAVGPGDAIAIPPGQVHTITCTSSTPLTFLCCCAPGYEDSDTVLVNS